MIPKIVPKFSVAQIRKDALRRFRQIEMAVYSRLQFIGEQTIAEMRERANFKDRTGNLRSSIGYVILHNGKQVANNFQKQPRGDGRKKAPKGEKSGVKAGKEVADDLAKLYPRGYVLIIVAGMDYAAAVESKGFDVITSGAFRAEKKLKEAMANLQNKIGQMR